MVNFLKLLSLELVFTKVTTLRKVRIVNLVVFFAVNMGLIYNDSKLIQNLVAKIPKIYLKI